MSEPHRFHASTHAAWGHLTRPFDEIMPVQASLSLPGTGGFGSARVDRFNFRGIFAFESAEAVVSGSYDEKNQSYDSTATVTITGLNIMHVLTADRVVARVSTEHPESGPLSVTPIGSYFENLRLASHPLDLDLAVDKFANSKPIADVRKAFESEKLSEPQFETLTANRSDKVKNRLREYFSRYWKVDTAAPCKTTVCSLIGGVRDSDKLPQDLKPVGHVIHVPGFGCIRLAELRIADNELTITMFQVDMGSNPGGSSGGGGASGGSGSDP